MSKPQKFSASDEFNYFLWKRHDEPMAWEGYLSELVATDGRNVRRLMSGFDHLLYQEYEDQFTSDGVVGRVERAVGNGVALLGYSMFSSEESLAILHTGDKEEGGWLAFPQKRSSVSQLPTMPMRVASDPRMTVVGRADVAWRGGDYVLEARLKQEGEDFLKSDNAFFILDHLTDWKVHARVGRGEKLQELRLTKRSAFIEINRPDELTAEATFPIEEVILKEFKDDPSFAVWFSVSFDRELFCLPEDWVNFWMKAEFNTDVELQ